MKKILDNSFLYFLISPFPLAFLIPILITRIGYNVDFSFHGTIRLLGIIPIVLGFVPLINSFFKFKNDGDRSPHPFNEAPKLVVTGFYSYVRNPMYVGVLLIISGLVIIFLNYLILIYGFLLWSFVNTFIIKYEEPKLTETFGEEFKEYRKNVHRWIPRIKPWKK